MVELGLQMVLPNVQLNKRVISSRSALATSWHPSHNFCALTSTIDSIPYCFSIRIIICFHVTNIGRQVLSSCPPRIGSVRVVNHPSHIINLKGRVGMWIGDGPIHI